MRLARQARARRAFRCCRLARCQKSSNGFGRPVSRCRPIAVGSQRAVLAHSTTGIIFGLAVGTFGIAMRLPQATGETVEFGGTASKLPYRSGRQKKSLSALECGPDWRFVVDPAATEACAL